MARQSELNRWKNVAVVSESERCVEVKLIIAPHCGEIRLSFREQQQSPSLASQFSHRPRLFCFFFHSLPFLSIPRQTRASPPTHKRTRSLVHTHGLQLRAVQGADLSQHAIQHTHRVFNVF